MKQILAILLITATIISCKKSTDDYYTITCLVLDWDSKVPISGAKVYVLNIHVSIGLEDSAVTDPNGRVSFRYKKEGAYKTLFTDKGGYVIPYALIHSGNRSYDDRTDTLYLARPSYVNVTIHKAGIYLPNDSVDIKVKEGLLGYYKTFIRDKADSPDKTLNLSAFYSPPYYTKLYFQWDMIRNATVLSSSSDSTDLIQFGTKNFNLNY